MKKQYLLLSLFAILVFFYSCSDDEETAEPTQENIVPQKFSVDIPEAISSNSSGKRSDFASDTLLDLAFIYEGLPGYIEIGEGSAELVEELMSAIYRYNLTQATTLEFTSDEDGRQKLLEVRQTAIADGETYDYGLQISDIEDAKVSLQVYWDKDPVKGFAILNLYEFDRKDGNEIYEDTYYKISYSEESDNAEAEMEVMISGIPVQDVDTFGIQSLRMMVQKNGDIVSVNGSSYHPNMTFDNGSTGVVGRNYVFRAKGDEVEEVGVAEIALPPSSLTSSANLYTNYSTYQVIINEYGSGVSSGLINGDPPGHFSELGGFLGDGNYSDPNNLFSDQLTDLSGLTPYIPNDIKNQSIVFVDF